MYSSSWIILAIAAVAQAANYTIQVGMNSTGGLATVYSPNSIKAVKGDFIEFHFRAKNHTVTQSSFAEPCTQQFNTATNENGADSGFMPVAANAATIPTWTIQVLDDSSPQWFFCNQANHCNSGMVFAINAPTSGAKTFDAFLAKAANATHPDPALHQTAPFTPTPAASASVNPNAATTSVDPNAAASSVNPSASSAVGATLTDSASAIDLTATVSASASVGTEAPANAAPSVSAPSTGLNLTLGSASATASVSPSPAAANSSGFKPERSWVLIGTLVVGLVSGLVL